MDSINMPQSASGEVGIIGGGSANHETSKGSMNMTTGSQMTQGNKASKQLKEALSEGQNQNGGDSLTRIMVDFSKTYDCRAVIFGTFYRCGFDLHELTSEEK